ncbi:uncharacterized protein LAESUDRAFT_762895 [Laetiporus sulphureus 93-53]|uniref:Uncharacterized protein n=1 Tax=Laetiporus sulphureus 93-53 TaxID=1314785 RepID=A0A165C7A9_9APHY|nr:uncharacterized protein LAESUDRAFT_762895 [Laetiporus sulphureus 93-53]KZT02327.1 hypothetical protein LAESUDRAFT_762895 [Laetiporus sulphureus 93-53]
MELDLDDTDADADTTLISDEDGIHESVTNDGLARVEEPTALEQSGNETATDVGPATSFWPMQGSDHTTSLVGCSNSGPSIAQFNAPPPASNALGLDEIMPSRLSITMSTAAPTTAYSVPELMFFASTAMQQGLPHAHPQGYDVRCWNQRFEAP